MGGGSLPVGKPSQSARANDLCLQGPQPRDAASPLLPQAPSQRVSTAPKQVTQEASCTLLGNTPQEAALPSHPGLSLTRVPVTQIHTDAPNTYLQNKQLIKKSPCVSKSAHRPYHAEQGGNLSHLTYPLSPSRKELVWLQNTPVLPFTLPTLWERGTRAKLRSMCPSVPKW